MIAFISFTLGAVFGMLVMAVLVMASDSED